MRRPVEALVELLAGIPSVVFGLVGLGVVVPFVMDRVVPVSLAVRVPDIPLDGTSLVAAIIVLTFMILPFVRRPRGRHVRSIPRSYINGGPRSV